MFKNLKSKIITPTLGVIFLLVAVLIAYTSISLTNFTADITQQRLETAIQTTNAYMASIASRNHTVSIATAQTPLLVEHLSNWNAGIDPAENRLALLEYLTYIGDTLGIDSFVVVGQNATVALRTHAPDTYDDSVYGVPLFMRGLQGEIIPSFSSTAAIPMAISNLVPIWHEGEVIGTLSVNWTISTDSFVEAFAEALNAEVTIFRGYERVATTIRNDAGQLDIGTYAPQHIVQAVIDGDSYYAGDIMLNGVPFSAYYFPLHGWADNVIGMFSVAFSNEQTIATANSLQFFLVVFAIIGLAIAFVVIYLLTHRITRPVTRLAVLVDDVSQGKLNVNIDQATITQDEIGKLTTDVFGLVGVIKTMVDDLSNVHTQYVKIGDIHHQIDDSKYQNSFKEMVTLVNNLTRSITADIKEIADIMNYISDADRRQTPRNLLFRGVCAIMR